MSQALSVIGGTTEIMDRADAQSCCARRRIGSLNATSARACFTALAIWLAWSGSCLARPAG